MDDEVARRIDVNYCVRDGELAEIEAAAAAAEPGEWRVRDGRVVRYAGEPVTSPASLALMAKGRSWLPRLLRGVRVLERELRTAWAAAGANRRELVLERELHLQATERAATGKTGPDADIDALVEAIELGAFSPDPLSVGGDHAVRLRGALRLWATGGSFQAHPYYRFDLDYWRRRAAERAETQASVEAEYERKRRALQVLLDELELTKRERKAVEARASARLAAGEVPGGGA